MERTESWVSRRLGLVAEVPESVQRHVWAGAIGAHAAMRYLLPLARANRTEAERLADAVAPLHLSTRAMAHVMAAWTKGAPATREMLLKDPALVVRAYEQSRRSREQPETVAQQTLKDLRTLGRIAARAQERASDGLGSLPALERAELRHELTQAQGEVERLFNRLVEETKDAG